MAYPSAHRRTPRPRLVHFVLCLCLVASTAVPRVAAAAEVSGQIVDPSGRAVPRALVRVLDGDNAEAATVFADERGFFTVDVTGSCRIEVTLAGFQTGSAACREGSPLRIVLALAPVRSEMPCEQIGKIGCNPRWNVDAVRHGGDRPALRFDAGPHRGPHLARDLAVQLAHRVDVVGRAQRQRRHVELRAVAVVVAAEGEELLAAIAEMPPAPGQVRLDMVEREGVVAGRDRRVGREDRGPAHFGERVVERESLVEELVDPLQHLPPQTVGLPNNAGFNDVRRNLAFRNLTRAKMVKLATGQQMANFMKSKGVNVTKLTKAQIRDGKNGADLGKLTQAQREAVLKNTPLLFYVLREAELNGGKLSGVGARIVGETFHRAMEGSMHSIVRDTSFHPTLGPNNNTFRMVDLLMFAFKGQKSLLAPLG